MRILFTIEYSGENYSGFQSQKNAVTVQNVIENALNRVTGEGNKIIAAGRTDEGVHALALTAHFDTEKNYTPEKFRMAVNAYLPDDIVIIDACKTDEDFHARYSAKAKTYLYKIYKSRTRSAVMRSTHMQVLPPLDIELMKKAAEYLKGEHDFAAFCKAGSSNKTTERIIYDIDIEKSGSEIYIKVRGNGFLYNMVRIIVGLLINVGQGKYPADFVPEIINSKDRKYTRLVAQPQGLYLLNVEY